MGCICGYSYAVTQEMINLIGFNEKLNVQPLEMHESRYFLAEILYTFKRKGKGGKS